MYTSLMVVCACACVCFYLLLCTLASQHWVYGHSHCFQDPWVPFHVPSSTSNCLRITALLLRRLRMRTLNSHRIFDSPLMRISVPHIFRQPSARAGSRPAPALLYRRLQGTARAQGRAAAGCPASGRGPAGEPRHQARVWRAGSLPAACRASGCRWRG